MASYLGIDLGTSGLRALLTDGEGRVLASAERGVASRHPHPGWSEQDPADWIAALEGAVADVRAAATAFANLEAIAVAGHMHGATLLDAEGAVVRPCILWNDTRAEAQAARLDAMPAFRARTGNIVFPGFTAPKLDWLRAHDPEAVARTAKVLLPAAFLNHYLTGAFIGDLSDASGTAWLDVGRREWADDLLAATHMRRDQMPDLVDGSARAGVLRRDLARSWGVGASVVVAGGAGDNAAAACGIGALEEGQGFVSLGTSGVVLVARDGYHPAPGTAVHTFCHAVPGRWYQMGVMLSATASLNWLARITGRDPAALTGALRETLRPPGKVRFLPYLAGERTPHNDAHVRGAFLGLGTETGVEEMTRAVLEGVAFGLRDSAEALAATGARMDRLFAVGGGTRSRYWLRLLATVLDTPLALPDGGDFGAALGAVRLAMAARQGGDAVRFMTPPEVREVVTPEPALRAAFDAAYADFRAGYGRIT